MKKLLAAAIFVMPVVVHADPIWAVRPEPGLVCMAMSRPGTPILNQPSSTAAQPIASAGPIVFVVTPQHVEAGFVEIERPNKQLGWIPAGAVSAGAPGCVPMLMSNGLIMKGFPDGR